MNNQLKGILQYSVLLIFAALLLWLALGSIEVGENQSKLGFIFSVWQGSDKSYLLLSAFLAIISHLVRAQRWKILLQPAGHKLTIRNSFLSVMVGYFINLAIPRGGELSRCYNLYRLDKTPIDVSFGTVVAERVIDLIILLSLIGISFAIEWTRLSTFFGDLNLPWDPSSFSIFEKAAYGLIFLSVFVVIYLLILRLFRSATLRMLVKIRGVLRGMKKGLLTIFSSDRKVLFLLYSLTIWILYYLMSYSIVLAFEETATLTMLDTLTIFVIGGIAMAIPLPGGTGSYHVLVPLGLVSLFAIPREEAVAFSFIFHGWQTIVVIILGIISMLYTQWLVKKNKKWVQATK